MESVSPTQSVSSSSPVTAVVELVADREGTDPMELQPPLYDVIDPEALNALFAPTSRGRPRESGQVSFEYLGYDVTVRGNGDVSVRNNTER
ncbi:HalOD1 output domain-containing protein [Saliphagus sp. GCM10025308]